MASPSEKLKTKFPIFTSFILGTSLLSYVSPQISAVFIYDRFAILNGEIWRLFSAHLVHFTALHLLYNFVAFGIAGWIIEYKKYQYFKQLCLFMAFFISIFLMAMKPNMLYYGGLSGLASGAMYYLALLGLGESRAWRLICIAILLFVPLKIFIEMQTNQSIIIHSNNFIIAPLSHLIGCGVAVFFFIIPQFIKQYF